MHVVGVLVSRNKPIRSDTKRFDAKGRSGGYFPRFNFSLPVLCHLFRVEIVLDEAFLCYLRLPKINIRRSVCTKQNGD